MQKLKKIIHIDMDCFYAAIEIRDNPSLADKPVAVGGSPESRGVLCTCNYIARKFGIHSAMSTTNAYRLCRELTVLPVDMPKYKQVAANIQRIFYDYTDLVEPIALDEAYLDVSDAMHCKGSATLIAKEIRERIWNNEKLTASAGVAANKFLAKIASGWKKPNGLFVIKPNEAENFVKTLDVKELYGVGKVNAEKLLQLGFKTCADLQKISLAELTQQFGKLGKHLFEQCRGQDSREVIAERTRKSLSVEHTFPQDITDRDLGLAALKLLYEKLLNRIQDNNVHHPIKKQFLKVKFSNFRQITSETSCKEINFDLFQTLYFDAYAKGKMPIRLLGIGVHFNLEDINQVVQQSMF